MQRITWRTLAALRPGQQLTDPAVHGDGFSMRYRRRKEGIFAQLRVRTPAGWIARTVGWVPTEAALAARTNTSNPFAADFTSGPLTAEQAIGPLRHAARQLHAKVLRGEPRAGDTLGAVIAEYLKHRGGHLRATTLKETTRYLMRAWSPIHGRPAGTVTRREVATLLRDMPPVSGNRARACLSAVFNWAIRQGMVDANPVFGTDTSPEVSRDRVLGLEELRRIWTATEDPTPYNVIVEVAAADRRTQARGRRDDLDARSTCPPGYGRSRPAGRRTSAFTRCRCQRQAAMPLVLGLPRGSNRHVFPGRTGAFQQWAPGKRGLDARSGVTGWVIHDIRRSVVTHLAERGVPPHVVEALVNHVSGHRAGVAGIYNRAVYADEKRAALQAWADAAGAGPGHPAAIAGMTTPTCSCSRS